MSRRASGEGTIRKRADGRYEAIISVEDPRGRRRKSFYGQTQAEVRDKLIAARRKQQQGIPLPNERLTLGAFLTQWLAKMELRVRPTTFRGYRNNVKVHIIPELGRVPLTKLTPRQVGTFVERKLQSGKSPRTVQYIHAVLRAALNDAMAEDLVGRNVAEIAGGPSVPRVPVRPLGVAELQRFIVGVEGDDHEALYLTAITSGLRQGELLGLRWEDIDFDASSVRVVQTIHRLPGAEAKFGEPKTDRSRRTVMLPEFVLPKLRQHRSNQRLARLKAGSQWRDFGLVFPSSVGTPLDGRNVTQRFQRKLAESGLRRCRFHDLRHAYATLLLGNGENPRVVMELLGHSQFSLTMNTYAHVMPSLKHEAAQGINRVLTAPLARGGQNGGQNGP